MSDTDFLVLLLHVVSLVVYGGATAAVWLMLLPAAAAIEDPALRRKSLTHGLRVYNPLAIATLGLILFSGFSNLTSYKAAFRAEFFAKMGWLLVWKLSLAFVVIMVGVYIPLGLAHRIVRNELLEDPVDEAWLNSMTRRLRGACIVQLILLTVTVWFGLHLGHPH